MVKYKEKFIEIFEKIKQADNILMVCHKNPDSDCLGATCSLGNYFDTIGKKYQMFNIDEIPKIFHYLKSSDKISNDIEVIKNQKFDLIITLDTGSLDYSGIESFLKKAKEKSFLINIDHHISNTNYGDINLVIGDASSTSEIIYYLLTCNKIHIDKEMANHLLDGIVFDSGIFSNSATTCSSIDVASDLLIHGGKLPNIIKNSYQQQSITSLKLWGKVLSRLDKNEKYNIAYTYITYQDLKESNLDHETVNGISNFLNKLTGNKATFFIKEVEPGKIIISTRTSSDLIDLSKLAKILGGGGHQKAAGFSLSGTLKINNNKIKIENI